MDKIYSRRRVKLPKLSIFYNNQKGTKNKNLIKLIKITCIVSVAAITASVMMKAISPIIDKQCINMAKSIATKISNEQATAVMANYKYQDLCSITKDNNRKYYND